MTLFTSLWLRPHHMPHLAANKVSFSGNPLIWRFQSPLSKWTLTQPLLLVSSVSLKCFAILLFLYLLGETHPSVSFTICLLHFLIWTPGGKKSHVTMLHVGIPIKSRAFTSARSSVSPDISSLFCSLSQPHWCLFQTSSPFLKPPETATAHQLSVNDFTCCSMKKHTVNMNTMLDF